MHAFGHCSVWLGCFQLAQGMLHSNTVSPSYRADAMNCRFSQLTNYGFSPLGCAAEAGVETSVAFLVAAGARDRNVRLHGGRSSLWMAVETGNATIVRIIVSAGMDVIGGGSLVVLGAMCRASERRMARVLDMLLGMEGEARNKYWARQLAGNVPIFTTLPCTGRWPLCRFASWPEETRRSSTPRG